MNKLLLITLVSIFTITALNLSAQGFGERNHDLSKVRERIHKELNLTDEQESKIKELKFRHESEMIDLKAELEKKELALQEMKSKGNYTREEFLARTEDIIQVRNKIEKSIANHQMDIYELLDSTQKETWNEISGIMNKVKKDFRFHRKAPRFE